MANISKMGSFTYKNSDEQFIWKNPKPWPHLNCICPWKHQEEGGKATQLWGWDPRRPSSLCCPSLPLGPSSAPPAWSPWALKCRISNTCTEQLEEGQILKYGNQAIDMVISIFIPPEMRCQWILFPQKCYTTFKRVRKFPLQAMIRNLSCTWESPGKLFFFKCWCLGPTPQRFWFIWSGVWPRHRDF